MRNRLKTLAQYFLSFVLTVGFLYFAFRGTDVGHLLHVLADANYWWVLAMVPLLLLSHIFRTWRWKYFLRPIKRGLRFRNLFSALMVGYMLNNVLPRVGEIARPYAIGRLEGISRSAALGTVLMERIFDILSFMAMAALIPVVYSGPLLQTFPWLEEAGIWITAVTLGFLGIIVFFMMRRDLVERGVRFVTRKLSPTRAQLVGHIAHSFLDGFLFLKEPRSYFMIGSLSVLVWICYIPMMYFPFYAFGMVENNGLDMGAALVVQTISSIGFIIPTPGATGSYHYFTIQTLTKLYGVGDEVARSYATATHAAGFLSMTLIGIYYFLRDRLHLREVRKEEVREA